ncbi:uncharacterized protein E0L32_008690 [Thyridium curvatum]|uniref:Enoyl reductase (ER) domain-containing protein n=1 Tax=Thyridium curvatum TaxID=1093900 RepID=A0A507AJ46_9PEZI|nr:uncharacterized protein E0L32_008690 [Thyridium curvatum]TPX10285.1 hypothetical protein E0L32_008690 [Thyridium curvatum]
MAAQENLQRAAVLVAPSKNPEFNVQLVPRPVPGPNEVLVRLSLTSICGSDYGLASGELGETRTILGHEGVGRVVELGSGVPAIDPSVQVGQRVGVGWARDACGACGWCTTLAQDGETRCAERVTSGRVVDGTFAEYTVVPARYLCRIPAAYDGVPDEHVAPVCCGGVTAYKAIKGCGVVPGRWIAVSGAGGGVGALAVAFARAMGYRVVGVDAGADKGRFCLEQGAEHFVDITALAAGEDPGPEVRRLTGTEGVDAVIVTSGAAAAYQAAFSMLGPFGTLMCVGLPPADRLVHFHPAMCVAFGWQVKGSAVGTRRDILEALEFVRRGLVTPRTEWGRLEDMTTLLENVVRGKILGKYVIKLDGEDSSKTTEAPAS